MRVSKSRTSRRQEGCLSVRSAALLLLTLQRLMSQCWPKSLNGTFLRQMIDFCGQNLLKGFFHSLNFCYIFTKQSIISHGSLQAAQRRHCFANLASFPPRSLFSIISTFVWRQSSHLLPAKKKKWKLFSCLIWTLIICQKWRFDCVSSFDTNPWASMLMPAAKAGAHGNSVGFVNVCIVPSIFAGSLAGFIRRRW